MRVDTGNRDGLIRECCRPGATYDIAGMAAAEEEVYAAVGKLCRHFDLPGPNPASVEWCCDKFVQREGKVFWHGKCASDPKLIAHFIQKRAPSANVWCSRPPPHPCGSFMRSAQRDCPRSAPMRALPKQRSTSRRTKPTRMMRMV